MSDRDMQWDIKPNVRNRYTWEQITVLTLLDIRQELKDLNAILNCTNFLTLPKVLRDIRASVRVRRPRHKRAARLRRVV